MKTILPVRDDYWVCSTAPHVVPWHIVGPPFVRDAIPKLFAFDGESVWWIDARHLMRRRMPDGDDERFLLPSDVLRVASLVADPTGVYLGCISTHPTARALWCHPNQPGEFRPFGVPPDQWDPAQPICALRLDGGHLFAVDAGPSPKLLEVFEIDRDGPPRPVAAVRIPSGVDDHIQTLTRGRTFVAILSTTTHPEAKAWKVGLYEPQRLDEMSIFFRRVPWELPFEAPVDLLAFDDLLIFAQGSLGLGVCRLDDGQPSRWRSVPSVQPWSRPYLDVQKIRYTTPLQPGRVTRIAGMLPDDTVLCEVQHGSRRWWENLPIV